MLDLNPFSNAVHLDIKWLINVFLLLPYYCSFIDCQEIDQLPDLPGTWKEKELIRDLLHDYEKKARPVVDGVSPIAKLSETLSVQQITIEFGLSLLQILELDENEQVLTTSIRTLYRWKDYHMVWDPAEYDNITSVQIPSSKLWLPDIALYNHADERLEERRRSDLLVSYTGTVEWQPLAIYKSACFVNIKYFPFDQQSCTFKFGPWTYDAARTNITFYNHSHGWYLDDYEESPEWQLLDTKAVFTGFKYACCVEVFPDITFTMVIKRQPAFYNYVIILPCFLLSSLTLVLFCLPAETPAKMQLGMTMFQAFNFLLLILTQSIPTGASSFPLIGTYYCVNMFLATLSTFLCLIVVNCHFRGDSQSEVPRWAKKVFLQYGARIFFINSASSHSSASQTGSSSAKSNSTAAVGGGSGGGGGGAYRSTTYQTPPSAAQFSRCHMRDSFRGGRCSCETGGCYVTGGGASNSGLHENPSYYQPSATSLCLECQQQQQQQQMQHHHCQPMSNYCPQCAPHRSGHHCVPPPALPPSAHSMTHAHTSCSCEECLAAYREQEPPCRLPHTSYQRNAQPKSPFAEEEAANNSQSCPACAGLAAAAAAAATQDCMLSDASYNDAHCPPKDPDAALADVWASAAHHRGGRHTSNMLPPVQRRQQYYNTDNLLVEYISGGGSCDDNPNPYPVQCQQCDAERYAAKPDARVLRRVQTVTRDIAEIVRSIRYFQRKNEEKERVQKIINEWRTVGVVLDRLFFLCYIIAISISIILYFPRPEGSP